MTFRFLHSSDLHLGKPFGNFSDDLRGRLREARHTAIDRLAQKAREHGAQTILLAGDTFDTETPSALVLRQALAAIAGHSDLTWVMLAGNHDSLMAEDLWQKISADQPGNLMLVPETKPVWIAPDVAVLPAPCTTRRPGRDLTAWMDECDTGNAIRIGLAHGAIQTFSEDGNAADVIAPDRAQRARLDYLALGDWHGQIRVNDRTWYSGTPEPDRFKHNKPGAALMVTVDGPGATPLTEPVETGSFEWRTLNLELLSGEDATATLIQRLPVSTLRRQILLRVMAQGRTTLSGRTALEAAHRRVAPEFAEAQLRTDGLMTDCGQTDLASLDGAGALKGAARSLMDQINDETLSPERRDVAQAALIRLFSYCEAYPA
jgi:DNA repair exonuclease SbcCD nuclease subunit